VPLQYITLKGLFLRFKWQITITFILLTFEAILIVLIPYAIGLSIDSLTQKEFDGIYILAFILLLLLIIGTARRLYDTRVYSKIYALISSTLIKKYKKEKRDPSIIVTRSTLVKELVDFFEHDLTEAYISLVGIVGALVMISFINIYVFLLSLGSFLLIFLIYGLSEKKIFTENANLNRELENRLNIIHGRNIFIVPHFKKIVTSMVKLSDIESYNYIVIELLIAVLIITSLLIGVNADLTAGHIFSMLTYVLDFSLEVLMLPLLFQQFIRLKEITNRINHK
jgi:ABC-type multidrug transport system fused ATPase/permease subunit